MPLSRSLLKDVSSRTFSDIFLSLKMDLKVEEFFTMTLRKDAMNSIPILSSTRNQTTMVLLLTVVGVHLISTDPPLGRVVSMMVPEIVSEQ